MTKRMIVLWVVVFGMGFGYCPAWSQEGELVLEVNHEEKPITIDGKLEPTWDQAQRIKVMVREAIGGNNPLAVEVRALVSDETFYFAAQWADTTKSDMRDPFVWNAERKDYAGPTLPDDQFAIEFPLSGKFDFSMLTIDSSYTADVWHWKAGRGNPVGYADDKRHIISQEPIEKGVEYNMGGHGMVYIARIADEGKPAYVPIGKPTKYQGNIVDSFKPQEPSGSLADVRAKGFHDGKRWTLEMARKLNTGHDDDVVIDPGKEMICAIAVLNDELYWEHSVSTVINLRFSKPKK